MTRALWITGVLKIIKMHQSTLGEKIRAHIIRLISIFNLNPFSGRILQVYEMLTRESLALDIDTPMPRFSTINNDGIPFEFSVSIGGANGGLRFLTEIGVPGMSLPNRINMTFARLDNLLSYLGLKNATEEINSAFRILFPKDPMDLMGWRGGAWIAAGFLPDGRVGLRIYINAADGDVRERWLRVGRLLSLLGRINASQKLCDLSPLVSEAATPLGVAFDLLPGGLGRIKFYLRTYKCPASLLDSLLGTVGLSQFREPWHEFSKVLLIERSVYPDESIVLSLEFPREPDAEIDLKIDACAHCLFSNDQAAKNACLEIAKRWSIDLKPYEYMLEELSGGYLSEKNLNHHVFFGIGFSHLKSYRFNIYLKPAIAAYLRDGQTGFYNIETFHLPNRNSTRFFLQDESLPIEDLKKSVRAAAKYITTHQSEAGQWLDFVLPVGASDAWVTAYVGLSLAKLPKELRSHEAEEAIERACSWCRAAMQPDYGWGYNAFTESDADSSANTILFLSACKQPIPDACFDLLQSFQKQDGGFATYKKTDPNDSWGHCHPDVTPVVLNALLTNKFIKSSRMNSARKFVVANQNPAGIWQSYWWDSYLYSTWVNIDLLEKTGWRYKPNTCLDFFARQPLPNDAFRLSLLGGCLYLLRFRLGYSNPLPLAVLIKLIHLQCPDGNWFSHRILRLTSNKCRNPWAYPYAGDLFTDYRNLFTTATVLNCLTPIMNHLYNREKKRG